MTAELPIATFAIGRTYAMRGGGTALVMSVGARNRLVTLRTLPNGLREQGLHASDGSACPVDRDLIGDAMPVATPLLQPDATSTDSAGV